MKYNICKFGHPALRRKAEPIAKIDDAVRALASDMILTMKEAKGVGLAAQQIGLHVQMCVVNLPEEYDFSKPNGARMNPHATMPMILINPEILERSGVQTAEEACLSIPEISAPVNRAFRIKISFLDINGVKQTLDIKGFLARVIQHETDHLNGMLFVDRVSPVKKITLSSKLKRLKKKTETELGLS